MRSAIVLCAGVLLLGFARVGSAGQSGGTHAVTPQPTFRSRRAACRLQRQCRELVPVANTRDEYRVGFVVSRKPARYCFGKRSASGETAKTCMDTLLKNPGAPNPATRPCAS